ncbi:histidine kinase N-terminal 7TM domain-containing protein, partial [Klebsiella variicola]|uniref:histidine kinase N-terminal 7TM domain-containing protein n=1 Tax=Klebsiella variicola TaxID=244366 RepID=UPI002731CC9A
LIRQALKSWQHERRQAIALFFIALLPIIGSIMAIFDFDTPLMIQPFPLSLEFAAVILFWAVFRY